MAIKKIIIRSWGVIFLVSLSFWVSLISLSADSGFREEASSLESNRPLEKNSRQQLFNLPLSPTIPLEREVITDLFNPPPTFQTGIVPTPTNVIYAPGDTPLTQSLRFPLTATNTITPAWQTLVYEDFEDQDFDPTCSRWTGGQPHPSLNWGWSDYRSFAGLSSGWPAALGNINIQAGRDPYLAICTPC